MQLVCLPGGVSSSHLHHTMKKVSIMQMVLTANHSKFYVHCEPCHVTTEVQSIWTQERHQRMRRVRVGVVINPQKKSASDLMKRCQTRGAGPAGTDALIHPLVLSLPGSWDRWHKYSILIKNCWDTAILEEDLAAGVTSSRCLWRQLRGNQ